LILEVLVYTDEVLIGGVIKWWLLGRVKLFANVEALCLMLVDVLANDCLTAMCIRYALEWEILALLLMD